MKLAPPVFVNRSFTYALMPRGKYEVTRFSWNVVGGPQDCEIRVTSDRNSLLALLDCLRFGVTVKDVHGREQWWGFVDEVELNFGKRGIRVSLSEMANKVKVLCTISGASAETAYSQNTTSQSRYGVKERIETLSETSAGLAVQRAAVILDNLQWPVTTPTFGGGEVGATLRCKGWWNTLSWRSFTKTANLFELVYGGDTSRLATYQLHNVAAGSLAALGQKFTYSGPRACILTSIEISIEKGWAEAFPTINFCANDGTRTGGMEAPGTILATGTWSGGTWPAGIVPYTYNAINFTSGTRTLTPSTTYWIEIIPSAAWSDQQFAVRGETNDRGYYTLHWQNDQNGAIWTDVSPAKYMMLKVHGQEDYTNQIADVFAASEFILGTRSLTVAGLESDSTKDGTNTAQQIAESLLSAGTNNNRRLLATVRSDRYVDIYEEPTNTPTLYEDLEGRLFQGAGRYYGCPVGNWIKIKGLPLSSELVVNPMLYFCERAEYDAAADEWTPEARGTESAWAFGEIR